MLKILLVLLPLAASAACSSGDVSTCKKCGVGAIGMQFDSSTPCNCNDNAGEYEEMCPKTGAPTLPTCCSVDGKAATVQECKCGTATCDEGQMCTAATNTCAYPVCAKIDGSAASTSEKDCKCGTSECSKGEKCTAATNTCESPPPPTCGSGASMVQQCKCGTTACVMTQTCTASTNTCTSATPATAPAACKEDVVVTAACTCGTSNTASIGQTCPSTGANKGKPQWPACSGSDVFKTLNQNCKCADKKLCGYGSKCTQAGDFKGFCECVPSDDVACTESVPLSEKCPKTCDGHTAMGARPVTLNQCDKYLGPTWVKRTATNDYVSAVYYSDSKCTTKITVDHPLFLAGGAGGCQPGAEEFLHIHPSASGSTALQVVAMPVALVAGLLGFILL